MTEPRIYRASSMGYSIERLSAPHLGYEPIGPPESLQAAFDEGHRLEPIVIEKLETDGWTITGQQKEVNIDIIPGVAIIQGHIDGLCVRPNCVAEEVLEVKTMSHKNFLDWKSNGWDSKLPLIQKYKWQASCYMFGTGLAHVLVGWDKQTGEYWVEVENRPFHLISDLANKVAAAEQAIKDGIPPSDCQDWGCPFWYLHENKDAIPEEKADGELDTLMTAWLEADRKKKIYEGEAKALREMIVEFAGEKIVGKVRGSQGVTVTTTWVEAKEVSYKTKAHWETRVTPPKKKKVGDVAE